MADQQTDADQPKVRKGLWRDELDQLFREICLRNRLELKEWFAINNVDKRTTGALHHSVILDNHGDADKEEGSLLGIRPFTLVTLDENRKESRIDIALKSKVHSKVSGMRFVRLCYKVHPEAGRLFVESFLKNSNPNSRGKPHLVELAIASRAMVDPSLQSICPKVFHSELDEERERYFFVTEYLKLDTTRHLDLSDISEKDRSWDTGDIHTVLQGISHFHARYLGRLEKIACDFEKTIIDQTTRFQKSPELFEVLTEANILKYPELFTEQRTKLARKVCKSITQIYATLKESDCKTCVHCDFNPRNVCLRVQSDNTSVLCAYDWEMASIHVPQRDICEFLSFALPPETGLDEWQSHIDFYCACLRDDLSDRDPAWVAKVTGSATFQVNFDLAMMDFAMSRIGAAYFAIQEAVDLPFLPTVVANVYDYLLAVAHNYDFLKE